MNKQNKIEELLTRGVDEIIDRQSLVQKLQGAKKLRVKLGIDPNRPDLHIGHAVPLRKLRQFQELGHTAVLIIGDWTGTIGDPSGKDKTRPALSYKEVAANGDAFLKQAYLILDQKKTEVRFQSEWFKNMGLAEVLRLMSLVSVGEILSHETFRKRLKQGLPFALHETLYPLLQGYDSVMVKADLELGDPAQKFNVLMGRELQKQFGQKPQDIMLVSILVGLDGKEKMSKSLGNYISLRDSSKDMFGKVMSLPDNLIAQYFALATELSKADARKIIRDNKNPRDQKLILAEQLTALYHGKRAAEEAKNNFIAQFSKKELPTDIATVTVAPGLYQLSELLVQTKLVASKSEARRLLQQNGVKLNGKTAQEQTLKLIKTNNLLLQVGKRKFVKIN